MRKVGPIYGSPKRARGGSHEYTQHLAMTNYPRCVLFFHGWDECEATHSLRGRVSLFSFFIDEAHSLLAARCYEPYQKQP